jgi:hypothetical protein
VEILPPPQARCLHQKKNPADYAVNNTNKKIGMLLEVKVGDVIWYFKTDKHVSINPEGICGLKYKEMFMATVKM